MKEFRPMLATDADLSKLRYPLIASPKLDGIRAIVIDGVVMSRSLKPIPNKYVQSLFANCEYFDGELIVGDPTSKTVYRDTVSHVMAHDKKDFPVKLIAFDHIQNPNLPYTERFKALSAIHWTSTVMVLAGKPIKNLAELITYEEACLKIGYEGLILRDPNAAYKFGRSTAKEGILLKVKRFLDDEATVVGFEERMHNGNEATTNELGRTKRSSHAAGKSGRGDLGALIVVWNGIEFAVGTGFMDEERADIWANQSKYLGRLVKFKYFPVGVKTAPRHPVYIGWRDRIDV